MSNRLTLYQGNTVVIPVTVKDENSTVIDITGLSVTLTIYNGSTEVYQSTNTTHTAPASGITTFTISKTTTAAWPAPAVYEYEIEVEYSDGAKFTGIRDVIEAIADLV